MLPPDALQRPRLGHASPAWQRYRALWYAVASTAGRAASRLLWPSQRPVGRRRRRREEAQSPPRRLGGRPQALSPERSAHPDGAEAGVESEEMWRARQPSAGTLEAAPPGFIAACYVKRFHRERPAKVVPLADVAKRQQPSARDRARHPRERTDISRPPAGNMPRAARRRLRSDPLRRSAILLWPCARRLWRARSRGDERKVTSHGFFIAPRTGVVGRAAL